MPLGWLLTSGCARASAAGELAGGWAELTAAEAGPPSAAPVVSVASGVTAVIVVGGAASAGSAAVAGGAAVAADGGPTLSARSIPSRAPTGPQPASVSDPTNVRSLRSRKRRLSIVLASPVIALEARQHGQMYSRVASATSGTKGSHPYAEGTTTFRVTDLSPIGVRHQAYVQDPVVKRGCDH